MKSTQEITQQVQEMGQWIPPLREQIGHVVIGQKYLVDRLLLGLLANGHILLEGVPGLAKTLTVKTMAACIQTGFQRLQFTPDLLPADLIGTLIYNPRTGEFTTKLGPLFSNLILADEINRAPAKVQSALLEAMQERQVTIGETTYPLSDPFLVLATENPLEHVLLTDDHLSGLDEQGLDEGALFLHLLGEGLDVGGVHRCAHY